MTCSRRWQSTPPDALLGADGDHDLWNLVLEASRLDDVVEQVVRSLEFAVLAKYGFGLAQMFNGFYHKAPILNEEREDVRRWRAAGVAYFRQQLTRVLDLMGVGVPRGCEWCTARRSSPRAARTDEVEATYATDRDRPMPCHGGLPRSRQSYRR